MAVAIPAAPCPALDQAGHGPGLAFHARETTHAQLLTALAELTGQVAPDGREGLLDSLHSALPSRACMVVVDGLDEASSHQDRAEMAQTLVDLASFATMRVVVATRPMASGAPTRDLLRALGVRSPDRGNLAWQHYQADDALRDRLAYAVAHRAQRNYLVAALAAHQLATEPCPVDPAGEQFDTAAIPTGVGEALGKYMDGLVDARRLRVRTLLVAVAYARGDGLNDETWLKFASASGYPASVPDLDELRESRAADYLLHISDPRDGQPVTRLFHEALVDELITGRNRRTADEAALCRAILPATEAGWAEAGQYALAYAASHAAAAGELARLLNDAQYLAHADLDRLLPLLGPPHDRQSVEVVAVLRRCHPQAASLGATRRLRLFTLASAHLGLARQQARFAAACASPWLPRWAHDVGGPHQQLGGHVGGVADVAIGRLGGSDMVVVAPYLDVVHLWDVAGLPAGKAQFHHVFGTRAVAIGRLDARDVIVSGGGDGLVFIWDEHGELLDVVSGGGQVSAVAIGTLAGRDVVVTATSGQPVLGGDQADAAVRVWDGDGQQVGVPLPGHTAGLAIGTLDGHDVIASGDGELVRIWGDGGSLLHELGAGCGGFVTSIAIGQLGERDVIAVGYRIAVGGLILVFDGDGRLLHAALPPQMGYVWAVAVGRLGGRDVIAAGGGSHIGSGLIWFYDEDGQPDGRLLTTYTGGVTTLAAGRLGQRDVIVSGTSQDTVARIWDGDNWLVGNPRTGHRARVAGLAATTFGGRDVIVSAGYFGDATLRQWDSEGRPIGEPINTGAEGLYAVAAGTINDREIIAAAEEKNLRIWDSTGSPVAAAPGQSDRHSELVVVLGRLGDRDVIVTGGRGDVWIRDEFGRQIGDSMPGHARGVRTRLPMQ
jgi:WD40 repeat protein